MDKKKVFISYSSREPDRTIAQSFSNYLEKEGIPTFLASKSIRIGDNWSRRIEDELGQCDYFLVLLSENSLISDMITEEIRKAKERWENSVSKKPVIFPVRINLPDDYELNYDIAGYLNRIQQRYWHNERDTLHIVEEIAEVIRTGKYINKDDAIPSIHIDPEGKSGNLPVPNAPLEIPGGKISIDSPYYIVREGEIDFMHRVLDDAALLKIKGPRQFGKTSLLSRIIQFATQNEHDVVPFSFQQLNTKNLTDLERLLLQICTHISRMLGLPNKIKEFWADEYMDVKMKATIYFEDYILVENKNPVLLALDEADRLFEFKEISSEFFGMLRFWHEESKTNQIWQKMKLAITHSTESYLAISDLNQSPFNVGIDNILKSFKRDEVKLLSSKHGLRLTEIQISKLHELVGGHPFLVRKALYELALGNYTFNELITKAATEDGPYIDHLRRHYWNITQNTTAVKVMKNILYKNYSDNAIYVNKLRSAGIIMGIVPHVAATCRLYEIYFKNTLI
jgi:hypothetical protein